MNSLPVVSTPLNQEVVCWNKAMRSWRGTLGPQTASCPGCSASSARHSAGFCTGQRRRTCCRRRSLTAADWRQKQDVLSPHQVFITSSCWPDLPLTFDIQRFIGQSQTVLNVSGLHHSQSRQRTALRARVPLDRFTDAHIGVSSQIQKAKQLRSHNLLTKNEQQCRNIKTGWFVFRENSCIFMCIFKTWLTTQLDSQGTSDILTPDLSLKTAFWGQYLFLMSQYIKLDLVEATSFEWKESLCLKINLEPYFKGPVLLKILSLMF